MLGTQLYQVLLKMIRFLGLLVKNKIIKTYKTINGEQAYFKRKERSVYHGSQIQKQESLDFFRHRNVHLSLAQPARSLQLAGSEQILLRFRDRQSTNANQNPRKQFLHLLRRRPSLKSGD